MAKRKILMAWVAVASALGVITSPGPGLSSELPGAVELLRVPNEGLQPQVAVDAKGTLHLVYFKGDPGHGDIFYVRSTDEGKTFSSPLRVNSQVGSAVAVGTIRGAQLAVGRGGRVHVAWNGSGTAFPKGPGNPQNPRGSSYDSAPMLYARMNDSGTAFEAQRNLMTRTFELDGGGSVAADSRGNVYVAWHAGTQGAPEGEVGRNVWIASSRDEGRTFEPERAVNPIPTGACGCCGLRIFAASDGTVYLLYRSATNSTHRDIRLLVSRDQGQIFQDSVVDKWEINACPMTSSDLTEVAGRVLAAWQTREEVYYATMALGEPKMSLPVSAPGEGKNRKYAFVAANARGDTFLVWTEGTSWGKGGTLAWQVFDKNRRPTGKTGTAPNVPVWSFGSAFVRRDGGFAIFY